MQPSRHTLTLLADILTDYTEFHESIRNSDNQSVYTVILASGGTEEAPMILDLNGFGIIYTGSTYYSSVITVYNGAYLKIIDSGSGAERYLLTSGNRGYDVSGTQPESGSYIKVEGGFVSGACGGYSGICNKGTLELCGGNIAGNCGNYRGVENVGLFKMSGGAICFNNGGSSGQGVQGALWNSGTGKVVMSGGVIRNNNKTGVNNYGTFEMTGGVITENQNSGQGSGVRNQGGAVFTMSGDAEISKNSGASAGGGVYNGGTFTLNSGKISDNTAGGGAGTYSTGNFYMNGGEISGNTGTNIPGGGVFTTGTFKMSGGVIKNNVAQYTGNAVLKENGFMTIQGLVLAGTAIDGSDAAEVDAATAVSNIQNYGYIQVDPYINVIGVTGSFDEKIKLNFKFTVPEGSTISDNAYVTLTGGEDNRTVKIKFSEALQSDGSYKFSIPLVAKEASDTIVANVYDENGSSILVRGSSGTLYNEGELQYSLMQYFTGLANSGESEAQQKLGAAAKDYCTAAQIYFGYKADGLSVSSAVNEVTANDLEAYVSTRDGTKPADVKINGISAMLESDNTLRIYLTTKGSYTYKIDGEAASLVTKSDGTTYLALPTGTPSDELQTSHAYTIVDGSGKEVYTINASVLTYARSCVRKSDTKIQNLGKTLYLYNQAAIEAFGVVQVS